MLRLCCNPIFEKAGKSLKRRNISRLRGATLVELFVVMLIIASLVALLLPAMRSGMDRARAAKCLKQIRDLSVAAVSWSSDNNGRILPSSSNELGGWPGILKIYTKGKYVRCPTYIAKYHPERMLSYGPDGYAATGYGRNRFLGGSTGIAGPPSLTGNGRITQISQPSRTVAFYEDDNTIGGDAFGGYNQDGSLGGRWYYYLYAAHGDGFNVSFFDGHSEFVKFNAQGPFHGNGSGDYTKMIWKPY